MSTLPDFGQVGLNIKQRLDALETHKTSAEAQFSVINQSIESLGQSITQLGNSVDQKFQQKETDLLNAFNAYIDGTGIETEAVLSK